MGSKDVTFMIPARRGHVATSIVRKGSEIHHNLDKEAKRRNCQTVPGFQMLESYWG